MDYRSLTSLMLRIAGVLILVELVTSAPHTIANLLHFGGKETAPIDALALTSLALVLPLAIGLVLVYFPSTIASRIVRADHAGEEAKAVSESLLPVAIACLGVYFVSVSLYDEVYWLAKLRIYYVFEERHGNAIPLAPEDFAGMVSAAFQFIIGLVLLLGSRGIGKLAIRLRR
jgi:hypothetical protein